MTIWDKPMLMEAVTGDHTVDSGQAQDTMGSEGTPACAIYTRKKQGNKHRKLLQCFSDLGHSSDARVEHSDSQFFMQITYKGRLSPSRKKGGARTAEGTKMSQEAKPYTLSSNTAGAGC